MKVSKNYSLKNLNAFKVDVKAKYFALVNSESELQEVIEGYKNEPLFVLGDGYNTLFTKDFDGLVLKVGIKGIKPVKETEKDIVLEVGAGEDWHQLVEYSAKNEWSGLENLAYIPGTVGAAPIQNIAAYGQNFGDSCLSVRGYNLNNKKYENLNSKQCKFYYRDSIFKHELKNKFIITKVNLRLHKTAHFDLSYFGSRPYESLLAEIKKIIPDYPKTPLNSKIVVKAVVNLRKIKMPDWKKLPSAGSYFKNPFVSSKKYQALKKKIPDLQSYPINKMLYPDPNDPVFAKSDQVKIPAGKLLDVQGWRGKRIGDVGTFEKHALIVVNYGKATAKDILKFIKKMQNSVYEKYKIKLEPEVNII
jgi:UDP-N-acetylmuramate dehydrogenase